jgi:hypothetical protein
MSTSSTTLTSPLSLLLQGVQCQRRDQMDEAMRQLQSALSRSACTHQVIRLLVRDHPELASTVCPDDRCLPLHHAAALGDVAVAQHLLAKVRALGVFYYNNCLRRKHHSPHLCLLLC